MARNPALAGAIHDLQARLGSIRIAVTAVAGLDLDVQTRKEMLTSASDESVRASAELAGVSALATCLLDTSSPENCDLVAALHAAADTASLAGLDVAVDVTESACVLVRSERLQVVLPALLRIAAGAGKAVRVTVTADELTVRGADEEPLPPIAHYLVEQLDAPITITIGQPL